MIVNSKKRLCAFKFSDKEVKERIRQDLKNILIVSKYFGDRNGQDYYVKDLEEFEGSFLPPYYSYWNEETKENQYFDIPTKITKTKTFNRIQILNIATVEYIEFGEKVIFTIYFK